MDRLDKVWAAKGQPNGYRDQYPDCGPCEVCDYQGWRMTCHRLWSRARPGDRIWVRETFWPAFKPVPGGNNGCVYRADYLRPTILDPAVYHQKTWTPAIFMPRWASRLALEVLSVKAERLQDITEEDAVREGMVYTEHPPTHGGKMSLDGGKTYHPFLVPRSGWAAEPGAGPDHVLGSARFAFANLWNKINPRAPWENSPLVWRYELRRLVQAAP